MTTDTDALSWIRLPSLPDDQIPLFEGALLIARDEYPELQASHYEKFWREHERALRERHAEHVDSPQFLLAALNRYLFEELGFSGNQGDYYDPRNSYLNDVLDRKLGIPLSLGIVQIELGRRLGVPLEGVSFPGHFLVRMPVEDGLLVLDPYHQGRSIDADELKLRAKPHLGGQDIDDHQLLQILEPASNRSILMRMLRNLKGVYAERDALDKAVRCADRLVRLDPTQVEEVRDRGLLYLKLGHINAARSDLQSYLTQRPEASDIEEMRSLLIDAAGTSTRLN